MISVTEKDGAVLITIEKDSNGNFTKEEKKIIEMARTDTDKINNMFSRFRKPNTATTSNEPKQQTLNGWQNDIDNEQLPFK